MTQARGGSHRFVDLRSGNLLAGISELADDSRIGIYPSVQLQTFVTAFDLDKPLVYLIVDVDQYFRLEVPISELLQLGLNVTGSYVRMKITGHKYDGSLIGRVQKVSGGDVFLDDLRDPELPQVRAESCVPEAKRGPLNEYLQAKYRTTYQELQRRINEAFAKQIAPKRRSELIEGFVERRLSIDSGRAIRIADGLNVWLDRNFALSRTAKEFRLSDLSSPSFSFDMASASIHERPDEGLTKYGPHDHERMGSRTFRITVLAPEAMKGRVERFAEQLRNGLPQSRWPGFQKKYRLQGVVVDFQSFRPTVTSVSTGYQEACRQLVQTGSTRADLAIIVTKQADKALPPRQNPYYVCKNFLLGFDIPVQNVLVETLERPENTLQFIIGNIALASYAKLGGRPFVLQTPDIKHHELIFGVGSSVERESRFGAGHRVVGITTLFSRDGDYILNACTPYVDFDAYERRLAETVRQALSDAIESQAIQKGEKIRLIFHVFKETGRTEIQAIQAALAHFHDHDIEYAVVHVNTDHQFKLFDRVNPGQSWDWRTKSSIQDELLAYLPERGLVVNLGRRERLVTLIGPKQYKKRGCPSPLRVTLDRSSTFRDVDYLTQQIYHFAFMSWRGFLPAREPITILYSSLVADLNSKLTELGGWNPERVNINLRRKMWFL
jgi:hypothetical protein